MTRERIAHQLRQLHAGGIGEVQVVHLCPSGPSFGSPGDDPPMLSEAWWGLFRYALEVGERLGMRLWLQDQIGFQASDWYKRVLAEHPEWAQRRLGRSHSGDDLPAGAVVLHEHRGWVYYHAPLPEHLAHHGVLMDFLQPEAAAVVLDRVHGELERRVGDLFGRAFAGTFQDELALHSTWSPGLDEAFGERHGHGLVGALPALWMSGPERARARADYRRALADLAEHAFFRPLLKWHERHGLVVGVDQVTPGRQADPVGSTVHYHDYPATHRWFSAPGNDHNGEPKLHSSLAHQYCRSRVWLEAFHSTGWGGTLEETFHWLLPFFQQGATLYNPHAVYAEVKGGWWEWAPPSTCWRQPYWKHYPRFAEAVARLCWLLSQGHHVAKIAVVFPAAAAATAVTPDITRQDEYREGPDAAAIRATYWDVVGGVTWRNRKGLQRRRIGTHTGALNTAGYDFDLVDEDALAGALLQEGGLHVSDETFTTLILPYCIHLTRSTLERARALAEAGGTVIFVGALPVSMAGTRFDDPALGQLLEALLGPDRRERTHPGGGLATFTSDAEAMLAILEGRMSRDVQGEVYALHRRIEGADVYFVASRHTLLHPPERDRAVHPDAAGQGAGVSHAEARPEPPESAEVTFRATGPVRQLDPWSGEVRRAEVITTQAETTTVRVDFSECPGAVVVFGEALPEPTVRRGPPEAVLAALDGPWEAEVIPPGDNDWGDYAWPPHPGSLPVEIRTLRYRPEGLGEDGLALGWGALDHDDGDWASVTQSFAPYVEVAGPFEAGAAPPEDAEWRPYRYSQRLGIGNDPIHGGLLGPKGYVPREFLDFGPSARGRSWFVRTIALVPEATGAQLVVEARGGVAAWLGAYPLGEGQGGLVVPVGLAAGRNRVLLRFDDPEDERPRGAFFFAPADARPPYGHPLPEAGWLTDEPTGPFHPDLMLDPDPEGAPRVAWYRATLPPGAHTLSVTAQGDVAAFADGRPIEVRNGVAVLPDPASLRRVLALRVELPRGVREGTAFPLPLRFTCGPGTIEAGDWRTQGLPHHSGGVTYRRTFPLDEVPGALWLDLGAVRGAAEVRLNGSACGVRIWRPYRFDLTMAARAGMNRLEIEVRNTLGPLFGDGQPTPYTFESQASSGLFGPVRLLGE
jgi:hypothetical protein